MSERVFTDEMGRALKHAADKGTAESPLFNRATLAALVRRGLAIRWRGTETVARGQRYPFRIALTDAGRDRVKELSPPGPRTLPKRFQHWR